MYNELKGKKLLILGGVYQMIKVVQLAQKYGITVLVTDYLEDSPAKKYADKSFMVNATDVDAVVKLCKEEHVDGIITGYVDLLLPEYALICEKTGLPCYGSHEIFQMMTDKKLFKKICKENNVFTIPDYTQKDIEENKQISYPVIVKPTDSSGSRGISICNNYEELQNGITYALSFSRSKQYIVEKYMVGDEVVLYYYFQDGEPVFMGMCDRYVYKGQLGVAQLPTAYIFPSKYTESHIQKTDRSIKQMFKNIGVQNGIMFLQAFVENETVFIYEPGYRLNGAREQHVFGPINGIQAEEMLIYFALTGKMNNESLKQKSDPYLNGKYACILSPILKEGKVSSIIGLEFLKNHPNVTNIALSNDVGAYVTSKSIGTLRQLAYRMAIVCDSMETLKNTIEEITQNVDYRDDNNQSMLLNSFNSDVLNSYIYSRNL